MSVVWGHLGAQFVHLREVPGGGASQGGRVLHQHHLALELLHGDHLAILQPDRLELVEVHHPSFASVGLGRLARKLISAAAMRSISNQSL